jgi:hypothetical protein
MSLVSTPAAMSVQQARFEAIGYLALTYAGKRLRLKVCQSAAGHYIGTTDAGGTVSRESEHYFRSYDSAIHALETGRWQQRLHP